VEGEAKNEISINSDSNNNNKQTTNNNIAAQLISLYKTELNNNHPIFLQQHLRCDNTVQYTTPNPHLSPEHTLPIIIMTIIIRDFSSTFFLVC